MNKLIAALLSVLAATILFPTSALAVPAFARQTDMSCSTCHFQAYPILTRFGKQFKIDGFTLKDSQATIEDEHGLSLPVTLNMGVFLKLRYQKTNGREMTPAEYLAAYGTANPNPRTTNSGRFDVPDEFALFAAGRISEGIGALVEVNIAGPNQSGVANFKIPFVSDLGSTKLGVVPFSGDAGVAYGFDLFATGANTTGRAIENATGYSVAKYLGTHTDVTGLAVYLANTDYHVAITPWFQGNKLTANDGTGTALGGQYLRAAWTPAIGEWEVGMGLQRFGGNSQKGIDGIDSSTTRDSATIIDAQAQGTIAGMPLGIYSSIGSASASGGGVTNTFNSGPLKRQAFGVLADLGVIPEKIGVQLGFIRAKTGASDSSGNNETDNGWTLGMRYKMRQNVFMAAAYSKFSGSAYHDGGSKDANVAGSLGDSLLNITMVTGF